MFRVSHLRLVSPRHAVHLQDAAAKCLKEDCDLVELAQHVWFALQRAWLSVPVGTPWSQYLLSIARGIARTVLDYRGPALQAADPAATAMWHALLTTAAASTCPTTQRMFGTAPTFCAITCFVKVSVGVIAFGMTAPKAQSVLLHALRGLDCTDPRACSAFCEAIAALQPVEPEAVVASALRAVRSEVARHQELARGSRRSLSAKFAVHAQISSPSTRHTSKRHMKTEDEEKEKEKTKTKPHRVRVMQLTTSL